MLLDDPLSTKTSPAFSLMKKIIGFSNVISGKQQHLSSKSKSNVLRCHKVATIQLWLLICIYTLLFFLFQSQYQNKLWLHILNSSSRKEPRDCFHVKINPGIDVGIVIWHKGPTLTTSKELVELGLFGGNKEKGGEGIHKWTL